MTSSSLLLLNKFLSHIVLSSLLNYASITRGQEDTTTENSTEVVTTTDNYEYGVIFAGLTGQPNITLTSKEPDDGHHQVEPTVSSVWIIIALASLALLAVVVPTVVYLLFTRRRESEVRVESKLKLKPTGKTAKKPETAESPLSDAFGPSFGKSTTSFEQPVVKVLPHRTTSSRNRNSYR